MFRRELKQVLELIDLQQNEINAEISFNECADRGQEPSAGRKRRYADDKESHKSL